MSKSKLLKNIVTGFGGQLVILVLGFIVPRLILTSYGSDINGLLSTIAQVFTYMALLEAGIAEASKIALYKPVKISDKSEINQVLSATNRYFRKITILYGVGVLFLALFLPLVLKTDVPAIIVFGIVMLEGLSEILSFYFIQTPNVFLGVAGESYVNTAIGVCGKIIGYCIKIILAFCGVNVMFLQVGYLGITFAKIVVYNIYIKKNYPWLKYAKNSKKLKLEDRNSFVLSEIAWTVFSSTDMIVLSVFVSAQMSSVYAVYNMIFSNINVMVSAVYYNISYVLGHTYHEGIDKYEQVHDTFVSIFFGGMTVLISVAYVLTLPFVRLYTIGINDVEYIYPYLPLLFSLVQLLSWTRFVSGNLTGLAGYAKPTSYISLIEAIINVTLSIALVEKFGIYGVLAATVIALPLKVVWCIYIADKKVMKRSIWKTTKILGINLALFVITVITSNQMELYIDSYFQFLFYGVIIIAIIGGIGVFLNLIVNREILSIIRKNVL